MATFEQHCEASMKEFGAKHEEVHKWLDEFDGVEPYRSRHRKLRHHEQGIEMAVLVFGKYAGEVARQHIIIDLKGEGWKESDTFPKNEKHFVEMGLW